MWIGLIILILTIIMVETYTYIKRERREKQAIYLDVRGKLIKSEIINKPYMALYGFGRLAGSMKNKFILVYHIKDSNNGIFKVNVAQSDIYDKVAYIQTLNEGDDVYIRLKKYPDEDLYTFVENLSTSIQLELIIKKWKSIESRIVEVETSTMWGMVSCSLKNFYHK